MTKVKKKFPNNILVLLMFVVTTSCANKDNNISRTLLLEQSNELTLANGRELSGLLCEVAEDNWNKNRKTSVEYEQLSKLYSEFENFKEKVKNANRSEMTKIISEQNIKFKDDNAFKLKYFKFKPLNTADYNQLDDEIFKAYTESKISRFYVCSGVIISINHSRIMNSE